MLVIKIEDTNLTTRIAKSSGNEYQTQKAYVQIPDRDGVVDKYPRTVDIFPQRSPSGQSAPYPVGEYMVSASSFQVENRGPMDSLTLGNLQLEKLSIERKEAPKVSMAAK